MPLSLDIRGSIHWLLQESLQLSTIADSARLEFARTLLDGTGEELADRLWHDRRTLSGSTSEDLDLTDLPRTLFGASVAVALAGVRAVMIVNNSTTAGDDLLVGGAGAAGDAWAEPLDGDQDARVIVPADSLLLWTNTRGAWPVVDGATDTLRIDNPGLNDITYSIVLVGVSS